MRRWSPAGMLGVFLFALPAAAQEGAADAPLGPESADEAELDDERARLHFEAGRSHYIEGAYDRARDEFERAWELSRRPSLLLNLATVLERLGEHERAAEHLARYLELEPDAEDRGLVERRIANLRRLSSRRGADPAVAPDPEPAAPPASSTAPSGPDDGLVAGGAVMLGVAGAGLALTAVFGGLALAEDDALASGCGATVSCRAEDVADARAYVLVTDVAWISAAAAGAIGLTLIVVALATAPSGESAALRVHPYGGPSEAGVVVAGVFR